MFAFNSLPYTLSAEDEKLFKSLQAAALLPALAIPGAGELVELFKANKRAEKKQKYAPYADLLESKLKDYLVIYKEDIMKKLRETKSSSFSVELFSWKTVHYNMSLTQLRERESEMTRDEKAAHYNEKWSNRALITENNWESMFGVQCEPHYGYDEEQWTYYLEKVDNIFHNSDLALRLSLFLGPNFYPTIQWQTVEGAGADGINSFIVVKKTLCLRYCPFGVTKDQMAKLLECAKSEAQRIARGEKARMGASEWAVGAEALRIVESPPPSPVVAAEDDYADMPPLVPAGKHCFCGCADDDAE